MTAICAYRQRKKSAVNVQCMKVLPDVRTIGLQMATLYIALSQL